MLRTTKPLWAPTAVAIAFAGFGAITASAGLFKGHWYVPRGCPPCVGSTAGASTTVGHVYEAVGSPTGAVENHLATSPLGPTSGSNVIVAPTMTIPSGHGAPQVPGDQAILLLWVPKGVKVTINGYLTRNLDARGVHLGSRVFVLRGLKPDRVDVCTIVATMHYGKNKPPVAINKDVPVQGGGRFECRFTKAEFDAQRKPGQPPKAKPSTSATQKIETLVKEAEQSANEAGASAQAANMAAADAKKAAAQAKTEAGKAAASATRAEKAAVQAARSNTEEFECSEKSAIVEVKFGDGDEVEELEFKCCETPAQLTFRETTGALSAIPEVEIQLRYYFIIQPQGSDWNDPGIQGTDFELHRAATFKNGKATVKFFDPKKPDEHLAGEFRKLIKQKLAKSHHAARIKVEIEAKRSNGKYADVAPVGKRMTIELRPSP